MRAQATSSVTLVVNPAAGRGRALRVLPRVIDTLRHLLPQAAVTVEQTSSYEDAAVKTSAAVAAASVLDGESVSRDLVVVVGGDGMAHIGVNACAGTPVPLGIIPAGTGNDLCRGLDIPSNLRAATHAVAYGSIDLVDLNRVTGDLVEGQTQTWVGCTVSTGYDAKVSQAARTSNWALGPLTYAYHALRELARFTPLTYQLEIDGTASTLPAMLVGVSNSSYFGGGMKIAPHANLYDGLLDVTVVHPVSRSTLLRLLPRLYDGSFTRHPAVQQIRAKAVSIAGEGMLGEADGEILGHPPLRVECVREALHVLRPRATVPERAR